MHNSVGIGQHFARARGIASYIIAFAEIELSRYINFNTEYITFRIGP